MTVSQMVVQGSCMLHDNSSSIKNGCQNHALLISELFALFMGEA